MGQRNSSRILQGRSRRRSRRSRWRREGGTPPSEVGGPRLAGARPSGAQSDSFSTPGPPGSQGSTHFEPASLLFFARCICTDSKLEYMVMPL